MTYTVTATFELEASSPDHAKMVVKSYLASKGVPGEPFLDKNGKEVVGWSYKLKAEV
jgi:hypothetical protein